MPLLRRRIEDEFTHAAMTKQERYAARRRKEGRCGKCGQLRGRRESLCDRCHEQKYGVVRRIKP